MPQVDEHAKAARESPSTWINNICSRSFHENHNFVMYSVFFATNWFDFDFFEITFKR